MTPLHSHRQVESSVLKFLSFLCETSYTGSKFRRDSQLFAGGLITRLSAEVMSRQIVRSLSRDPALLILLNPVRKTGHKIQI